MSPHPIPDPSTILTAPVQAPALREQFRLAARARGADRRCPRLLGARLHPLSRQEASRHPGLARLRDGCGKGSEDWLSAHAVSSAKGWL